MTVTESYTKVHDAFVGIARGAGLQPFEVRVLVALLELDGEARSDLLEDRLGGTNGGSQTRRALASLYTRGLITGAAEDGRRRRRGVRTVASLEPRGREIRLQGRRHHGWPGVSEQLKLLAVWFLVLAAVAAFWVGIVIAIEAFS